MKTEPKFKVGDILTWVGSRGSNRDTPKYKSDGEEFILGKVIRVDSNVYEIAWWMPNFGDFIEYDISRLDRRTIVNGNDVYDYYYKKIPKTKLSLKLYAGKIEKEDKENIWIKPD